MFQIKTRVFLPAAADRYHRSSKHACVLVFTLELLSDGADQSEKKAQKWKVRMTSGGGCDSWLLSSMCTNFLI